MRTRSPRRPTSAVGASVEGAAPSIPPEPSGVGDDDPIFAAPWPDDLDDLDAGATHEAALADPTPCVVGEDAGREVPGAVSYFVTR